MSSQIGAVRRDLRVWVALLLLVAGVGLMDRGFAWWRNDARNFPYANGQARQLAPDDPVPGWTANLALQKGMATTGLAMLVLSVLLFSWGGEPGKADPNPPRSL